MRNRFRPVCFALELGFREPRLCLKENRIGECDKMPAGNSPSTRRHFASERIV